MNDPRVVITGMGAVTPIGIGMEELRRALREGRSGAGNLTRFRPEGFKSKRAFEVKNFTPPHGTRLLDPFIQYALAATAEAVEMAGFDAGAADPYRIGMVVSSSKGGMHTFHALRERLIARPSAILAARCYANFLPNFACQWIARKWKLQGPAKCCITACATGTTSIIEGTRMIQDGMADYVIAGASDASIVPTLFAGYEQMGVLSPDGMRPFDRQRKGFLLGEGAGIVFLETYESARARRAKIYGEIIGFATGTDCFHPVMFDERENALATTLKKLLQNARLSIDEIDYLNLHGTATEQGDFYETEQIKKGFGKKAYRLATSSTKSMMGHMLGASGAVEIIASLIALAEGFIPPTLHLENEDPRCDLDYTPRRSREKKMTAAVSISLGFGGHIAAIALRKI